MLNFDFRRTSRRCSVSSRVFQRGEEFYSALVEGDGELIRLDYAVDAWTGPPENCIGWWKSRLPSQDKDKVYWAPEEVLLSYLDHVRQRPDCHDIAYIMTLLLIRKKIVQLVETLGAGDQQQLVVRQRNKKERFEIPVVEVTPERKAEIQTELVDNLFVDHPPHE